MSKSFRRNIEDFVCENCGVRVVGDGYTNHCPKCLWSKHVDKNPGDREEQCGGMMEPAGIIYRNRKYTITHRCNRCGFEKNNRVAENDDIQTFLKKIS